jgi:hypothetical protein
MLRRLSMKFFGARCQTRSTGRSSTSVEEELSGRGNHDIKRPESSRWSWPAKLFTEAP